MGHLAAQTMAGCRLMWQFALCIEHARRAGRRLRQRPRRTVASRARNADIRAWAKDQGIALRTAAARPAVPSRPGRTVTLT